MIHFLSFHILLTPKIREECRECICKPLVYNTISKDLVFFKQHTPIKIFKPRLVDTLYHKNVKFSIRISRVHIMRLKEDEFCGIIR